MSPTIANIREAARRIQPYIHRTPALTCRSLNQKIGVEVYCKCENLQKVGAFKFRGACNAVFSLPDADARRGVAAHSSGNHAQALALAARLRGIPAYIVMPANAPAVKQDAVAGYGAQITLCEPTLAAREAALAAITAQTGALEIHPYNNELVIAGQGTATLELLEEAPWLDAILTPVGGGGLLSGTALAAAGVNPAIRVIGVEPEGADDARRSLAAGRILPSVNPQTIADGLLTSLGSLTFPIIQQHVEQIVAVSEAAIIAAMRFVWERMKLIIEPSAAVPLAALWEERIDLHDRRVGVIFSGGNTDLDRLPWH